MPDKCTDAQDMQNIATTHLSVTEISLTLSPTAYFSLAATGVGTPGVSELNSFFTQPLIYI